MVEEYCTSVGGRVARPRLSSALARGFFRAFWGRARGSLVVDFLVFATLLPVLLFRPFILYPGHGAINPLGWLSTESPAKRFLSILTSETNWLAGGIRSQLSFFVSLCAIVGKIDHHGILGRHSRGAMTRDQSVVWSVVGESSISYF